MPWFAWLAIALVIAGIVVAVRVHPTNQPSSHELGEPKAAIVDQLYSLQPNEALINEITNELEAYGFKVDLYQGDEVTVDFYRQLPSFGYQLIIFRAHSGLLCHQGDSETTEVTRATCLFTNEKYSETKHVKDQLDGQLARARVDENHPVVFGIGARFIKRSMKQDFPNTVIIIAGCSCLRLYDLAHAFIDKGASSYLAWDDIVELDYVDEAGAYLVGQLCREDLTVEQAVRNTMAEKGPDPKYGAILKYFPPQSGGKTAKELIGY